MKGTTRIINCLHQARNTHPATVELLATCYNLELQEYLKCHLEIFYKFIKKGRENCPLLKVTGNIKLRISAFPLSVFNSTF